MSASPYYMAGKSLHGFRSGTPTGLNGYHITENGRGSNDIAPFSLNGVTDPAATTWSNTELAGIATAALVAGVGVGYAVFHKKK